MPATMIVIRHGLRHVPLGNVPAGKGLLNLSAVRRGIAYLMSANVERFNDNRYHVLINLDAFRELIEQFTAADAADAGFERIDESASRFNFAGLRWETDPKWTYLSICGPKSSPDNPHVIDLVQNEVQVGESHDSDSARSSKS